jgi:large subunit ribosomal protein L21
MEVTVAYAIIQAGGKQFRVTEGQVVRVPSIAAKVGAAVEFNVLVEGDGDRVEVGSPTVDGSRASATVVEHGRGPKIIVFKKKRRKQYKKTHGHRQDFTAVRIESIGARSKQADAEKAETVKETRATAEAETAEIETAEIETAETQSAQSAETSEVRPAEPAEATGQVEESGKTEE